MARWAGSTWRRQQPDDAQVPREEVVTVELVHRPGEGPVVVGSRFSHRVVQVDDLIAITEALSRVGLRPGPVEMPGGPEGPLTLWLTDPDGYVPINGAHGISRFLRRLAVEEPRANLAGLYDEGEEDVIRAALERAGYGPSPDPGRLERIGFFACSADLEDELIRAAGEPILSRELEGDARPWHTFRKQPAWQGRPVDQQFRRFIRSVSDRNSRYIRAIVETIDRSRLPRPVRLLLDYVEPGRVPRKQPTSDE